MAARETQVERLILKIRYRALFHGDLSKTL
nr:MAG TPA: hypothetical protein [Caudoviricetes sp.]